MTRVARLAFVPALLLIAVAAPVADAGKPPPPMFYISSSGTELENFGPLRVVVSRTGNLKKVGSVTFTPTSVGGGATAGTDFDGTASVLTFARNQQTREVFIPIIDDTANETDLESISLVLSHQSVGVVAAPGSSGIIDDDDSGLYAVAAGDVLDVTGNLGACNTLRAAVINLSGVELALIGTESDCVFDPVSTTWLNDTGSPVTVKIALYDTSCDDGYVYYSDHTGTGITGSSTSGVFDHAGVAGDFVMINDAGGLCEAAAADSQPTRGLGGNLAVSVTSAPPPA